MSTALSPLASPHYHCSSDASLETTRLESPPLLTNDHVGFLALSPKERLEARIRDVLRRFQALEEKMGSYGCSLIMDVDLHVIHPIGESNYTVRNIPKKISAKITSYGCPDYEIDTVERLTEVFDVYHGIEDSPPSVLKTPLESEPGFRRAELLEKAFRIFHTQPNKETYPYVNCYSCVNGSLIYILPGFVDLKKGIIDATCTNKGKGPHFYVVSDYTIEDIEIKLLDNVTLLGIRKGIHYYRLDVAEETAIIPKFDAREHELRHLPASAYTNHKHTAVIPLPSAALPKPDGIEWELRNFPQYTDGEYIAFLRSCKQDRERPREAPLATPPDPTGTVPLFSV